MITSCSVVLYSQAKKKANKDTENWRYEIEVVQTGTQGTYLIKVWSYSKKPAVAIEQAKKMLFTVLYLKDLLVNLVLQVN